MTDYTLFALIAPLSIAGGLYLLREARRYRARKAALRLLDVVALRSPLPDHGLAQGETGTVVELLAEDTVLVEFAGPDGAAKAVVAVAVALLERVPAGG